MNKQELYKSCDLAQEGLHNEFWDAEDKIYRQHLPHDRSESFCYWWHAHVIDALIDGYLRTDDKKYLNRVDAELEGTREKNGGNLINNWYDDMEWMALALLRMWDITKDEKYKTDVLILWEDIKTAWNDHMGGGMAWKKDQLDYKNTPANGPAAILALRLYQRFNVQDDLDWGKKIYFWNLENLVEEDGFVLDGMNRLGDGKIDYEWEFTYCQGVLLGAALELYKITDEKIHLDNSIKTARVAKKRLNDAFGGIMPYEGENDCGLFKGIFVRYIYELIKECRQCGKLADLTAVTELSSMLITNAEAIIQKGMNSKGVIGSHLDKQPVGIVDLAQDLSGIMILEMAAKL